MEMPKPTDADKQRFRDFAPDGPGIEVKPMFGNLGCFVNGHMFMGLFGASIGLKLGADDSEALLAEDGTGPFGPAERPMGGYVAVPDGWSAEQASPWVEKALANIAQLPPKPKKPKKRS